MKPINYMELLSDLPENLADCAFLTADPESPQEQCGQAIHMTKGEKRMKEQGADPAKQAPLRIGRAGIAAAIALCLGLNGALIYGISKMKAADSITPGASVTAESEPGVQDIEKPYMEIAADISDPMPTGIMINLVNHTEQEHIPYNPVYIVTQNGEKAADCEPYTQFFDDIAQGESLQLLCFEQLPPGSYTLVNLAEDGETEGILGHLDFEISDVFDSMVWIPSVHGMQYEEAKALLEEKGVTVVTEGQIIPDADVDPGAVSYQRVPPYKTEQYGASLQDFLYSDGKGYWVNPGDEIKLFVNIGAMGDPTTVPDVTGMDWEDALKTLQDHGLIVDKRARYDDEVPSGQLISIDPEPGTEVTVGSYVRVIVSQGKKTDSTAPDFVGSGKKTDGTAPDFVGMDWESAKQTAKESGIHLIKYLIGSDEPAGTVVMQGDLYRNPSGSDSFVVLHVAKKEGERSIAMQFTSSWCQPNKTYYYNVRNVDGEMIGATSPFSIDGTGESTTDYLYPDCSEEHTIVTAYLVDWETNREEAVGSYILHPETATYETVDEDLETAFRGLND